MKDQTIRKNNNPKARKESKRKTSDGGAAEDNERLTIRKELQSFRCLVVYEYDFLN